MPKVPAAKRAIAANVRRLRRASNLTQAALAEAVDSSPETVSRIERGAMEPGASLLSQLAQALGTTVSALPLCAIKCPRSPA